MDSLKQHTVKVIESMDPKDLLEEVYGDLKKDQPLINPYVPPQIIVEDGTASRTRNRK